MDLDRPIAVDYVISSHVSYLEPRRALIRSMLSFGVNPERITVVIGGSNSSPRSRGGEQVEVFVEHNSFDFTGMIWLAESLPKLGANADSLTRHFVFLHDTMLFGSRSDSLFRSKCPAEWATAAEPDAQCNLVCYRLDYLIRRADDIIRLKNCDKLTAIQFERHFWQSCNEEFRGVYPGAACTLVGKGCPYGGASRHQEYYPAVDVTKWKANWGQSMSNFATEP